MKRTETDERMNEGFVLHTANCVMKEKKILKCQCSQNVPRNPLPMHVNVSYFNNTQHVRGPLVEGVQSHDKSEY